MQSKKKEAEPYSGSEPTISRSSAPDSPCVFIKRNIAQREDKFNQQFIPHSLIQSIMRYSARNLALNLVPNISRALTATDRLVAHCE